MPFHDRQQVMAILGVSRRESYRIAPPTIGKYVSSQELCHVLNVSCAAGQRPIDESAGAILPRVFDEDGLSDATGLPVSFIHAKTRVILRPIPHWRITPRVVRYHLPSVQMWIDANTRTTTTAMRKAKKS